MEFINEITKILINSGIKKNEAVIESQMLLETFASLNQKDIILGKRPNDKEKALITEKAEFRAATHIPIQYITGFADFMGEKFIVNKNVLIPRDETEILVRKAIDIITNNNFTKVLDLCTGSGCIACMIAKLTDTNVLGTDISSDALQIAIKNMEKLSLFNKAVFRKSDLFCKIYENEKFDIIVSNPPYIPKSEKKSIQKEVQFEPEIALYTNDKKGVEFYEKIIKTAPKHLNPKGYLIFELGIGESGDVYNIFKQNGFQNIVISKDLAGIDRVISAQNFTTH